MARNPVVFENGTLVQKANVEIDGTIYEVEPAQYDGTTPLSASNLNQLQTNLYDYVDENIENVYIRDDYAEVEATLGPTSSTSTTSATTINYPEGFTKDNCYVLGYKFKDNTYTTEDRWYATSNFNDYDRNVWTNPHIILRPQHILLNFKKNNSITNITIKILLMKIS